MRIKGLNFGAFGLRFNPGVGVEACAPVPGSSPKRLFPSLGARAVISRNCIGHVTLRL